MKVWRAAILTGAAAVALGLMAGAGRAGDGRRASPAPAEQDSTLTEIWKNSPFATILEGPKLWTDPGDPKDWVKASRPKDPPHYMPVGVTPPSRSTKMKTQAELDAAKAELEADRARMQDIAVHKPVLGGPPLAPPPAPVARKPAAALAHHRAPKKPHPVAAGAAGAD